MAKPKLCLIPASQGSKLFSVLPSSGVGDFNFSRSGKATRINSQGLIEEVSSGQSRLNYPMIDGKVVGCPHHILEPQRTNLITYSEDFSDGSWIKTNATIQLNSSISPDGTLNAVNLIPSTSSGVHNIKNTPTLTNNYCSGSWFVKANGYSKVSLREDGVFGRYISCDLSNGTILDENATTSAEIENYGNGWYRIKFTDVVVSSGTKISLYVLPDSYTSGAPNQLNWSGNGSDGVLIYGAMLEDASYVSSYIPTNGEVNGVTRSAETANGSGDADTFNDSEGVLMAEISALSDDLTFRVISLSDGSGSNRLWIYYTTTSNVIQIFDGSSIMAHTLSDVTTSIKILAAYDSNGTRMWINGYQVQSRPYVGFSGFDRLNFSSESLGLPLYGNTKQVQYYNSVLTDSELEQLTSWTSFTDMAQGQQYSIK